MLPVRDINPRRTTPFVNYVLITLNIVAFAWELTLGPRLPQELASIAFIPRELFAPGRIVSDSFSIFVSMFLHAGWLHIGSNMLYLWIFGDNVEDRMGHGRYLIFYLLCGVIAALAHAFSSPGSQIPAIGASGAIAGVLGAYLVLFPHARVMTFIPFGFVLLLRELPALLVLGLWFVLQLFTGVASLGIPEAVEHGGVAWWAHIGGFVAGLSLVFLFAKERKKAYRDDRRDPRW
ncbi:MAG: rhomboid family intramembrane serine protease [Thermoanaerobaculia bacterium]|nr:rhomboid family intramembrane serine protease [Thermoanaerobaculia bacterium]